jgi:hypothetical protein
MNVVKGELCGKEVNDRCCGERRELPALLYTKRHWSGRDFRDGSSGGL